MGKTYRLIIAGALALSIAAPLPAAAAVTINGDDDVTWRSSTRYNNTGVFGLFTKGGGTTDRAYVEFTLPDVAATSASLLLYNYWTNTGSSPVNYNIRIRGTEMDFSETGSAPSGTSHESWDIWVDTFNVNNTAQLYTLDITSPFNAYKGKTVTLSIRALSGTGDGPIFVDKEGTNGQDPANRPRIQYTPVPEPTSLLALALGLGALVTRKRR